MRTHIFYQLDVFTDTPFTGNPLAVFPDAADIPADKMQRIANEMNLSETVFVLPSNKALRRLRIFTPKQELPLAGHPVVGTWNMLARLGVTPQIENGTIEIEQELNLGVLPVEIEFRNGDPFKVTMTQGKWQALAQVTDQTGIARLATGLGLDISDIDLDRNLPIEVVSTGIRSIAVPICTLEALGRINVNTSARESRAKKLSTTLYSRTGMKPSINLVTHKASSNPSPPPAIESNMLSVKSCRTRRARFAPNAKRIPISLRRPAARASRRFATFAHAIRRMSPTIAIAIALALLNTGPISSQRPSISEFT